MFTGFMAQSPKTIETKACKSAIARANRLVGMSIGGVQKPEISFLLFNI